MIDGVVEGHCDCMYFVNTYRWDYPAVAALVAPRPLLIGNSDKDTHLPARRRLPHPHQSREHLRTPERASTNLGLLITEGPHKDTQDLQLPVFRWFNRHLKGEDPVIEMAATKFFTGQELKVFDKIPEDELTSKIHNTFVPVAKTNAAPDEKRINALRTLLREKVFRGWPEESLPFRAETRELSDQWEEIQFDSEEHVRLKLYVQRKAKNPYVLYVTAEDPTSEQLRTNPAKWVLVVRGGPDADSKDKNAVQIRRRYMLVGQTLDAMRVWDIRRCLQLLTSSPQMNDPLILWGDGKQSANALLAASLSNRRPYVKMPPSLTEAELPDYLNLLRSTTWDELRSLSRPYENEISGLPTP